MIDSFTGKYDFLSNFHISPILFRFIDEDIYAPTVEHAFQAAKSNKMTQQKHILKARTPSEAKKLGRRVDLIEDWDDIRDEVMLRLIRLKFTIHTDLKQKLLDTGEEELIEGNTWGDSYWGVCDGEGKNQLGMTLMKVRDESSPT